MNFSIVVILYSSRIQDSTTLQTLLQNKLSKDNMTLSIWNNGPTPLDEHDIKSYKEQAALKNIHVVIYQDIRNIALSKIYNFVLKQQCFDFFIPLDQDTELSKDYFQIIKEHSELDLIVPLVYSGVDYTDIKFPFNTENKQVIVNQGVINVKVITSVTSGLAIHQRLAKIFIANNKDIFDERFAFYGIDTAFFLNIHALSTTNEIKCGCFGEIKHSLSTYVEENTQASYRRRMEFLYYTLLYRLNYKGKSRLSIFNIILGRLLTGRIKDYKGLKNTFYCLIHKQHPRSSVNIHLDKLED